MFRVDIIRALTIFVICHSLTRIMIFFNKIYRLLKTAAK